MKNSLQLDLRMDMDINEFYNSNGESDFLTRVALQLGISQDRIKIVGIREGSVVINFEIGPDPAIGDSSQQQIELQILSDALQNTANNGTLDVGAPVLDFAMNVNLHGQSATVSGTGSSKAEDANLIWPMTLMVASIAVIISMVTLLIVCLRRKASKIAIGKEVDKDDPIFAKVVGHNSRADSIADSIASNVTSDRNLKQVSPFQNKLALKV